MLITGHRFRLFNCIVVRRCHQFNLIRRRNVVRFLSPSRGVLDKRLLNEEIIKAYRLHIPTELECTGIE